MKRIIFALLAIIYLLALVGCPPSTPNEDAFGPGPDRDVDVTDTDDVDETDDVDATDDAADDAVDDDVDEDGDDEDDDEGDKPEPPEEDEGE